ncbi:hypothetical protein HPP92_010178 [Vanilla planifolia]|uniref:Uncharacterized protein n=1 Tax=Vanilla planifolia TaxID=51239 RepID=A0A835UZU5_VANPL|nr:hypothetical protein HPP92_010178 [Vanilla planifolia]
MAHKYVGNQSLLWVVLVLNLLYLRRASWYSHKWFNDCCLDQGESDTFSNSALLLQASNVDIAQVSDQLAENLANHRPGGVMFVLLHLHISSDGQRTVVYYYILIVLNWYNNGIIHPTSTSYGERILLPYTARLLCCCSSAMALRFDNFAYISGLWSTKQTRLHIVKYVNLISSSRVVLSCKVYDSHWTLFLACPEARGLPALLFFEY